MLVQIYSQLFIMSVAAGGLYFFLKAFGIITLKCFTATWHYYTYVICYLFFLFPYHKFFTLIHLSSNQEIGKRIIISNLQPVLEIFPSGNPNIAITGNETATIPSNNFEWFCYFLIAGTLVFLSVILIQSYRVNRRIFSFCQLEDEASIINILSECKKVKEITINVVVYVSSQAKTPFLYGIFRPRIIMPDTEFTEEELRHIFCHELTHWKRHDALLKSLLLFANVLHWFNPLAYIIRHDIDRFCELSCDESVVLSMNNEERRRYCELILSTLLKSVDTHLTTISAFSNQRNLERRMKMIMKNEGLSTRKWTHKLAAIAMTSLITIMGSVPAFAASENVSAIAGESSASAPTFGVNETNKTETFLADVEGEMSESAPSFAKDSECSSKASWGKAVLCWKERDYAYASMKTHAGTAYYLYAKVSGEDALGSIPCEANSDYDASSVMTSKIFSRSTDSKVTWDSYGEIQDTATSGTQSASKSKTI